VIQLTEILNEIGEGVKPFPFKLWGTVDVKYWHDYLQHFEEDADEILDPFDRAYANYKVDKKVGYEFKSEKEDYFVSIEGYGYATPDPVKEGRKWDIRIRADFGTKEKGDTATNLGEQFAVMSTVVACVEDFVKKMDADKKFQVRRMEFTPKREPGESTGPEGTQRGKMYIAYIQKQLPRFEGQWKMRMGMNNIIVERKD